MPTIFDVGNETDLATALAAISVGGSDAAPNTPYTITLTAPISLTADAVLDLETGSSLTLEGDALYATGFVFTVTGTVTTDLNFTGTITLDGGSVDNVALATNGGGAIVAGYYSGQIVGTPGDGGDGVVNAGSIVYGGIGGAVDFTTGANTVDNTGSINASDAAGIGVFTAAGTVDNGSTADTAALISGGTFGVEITGAGLVSNNGAIGASGSLSAAVYLGSGTVDNGTTLDTTAVIDSAYVGVEIAGAGLVANDGTITGTAAAGVFLGSGTVDNGAGADTTAQIDTDTGNGVWVGTGAGAVNNFGTIAATGGVGVYLAAGGTLTNEDSAASVTGAFEGVVIGQPGSAFAGTVDNAGTITASGDASIDTVIGVYLANGGTVVNGLASGATATVQGGSDGVRIDAGAPGAGALVQNEGIIIGAVGVDFLGDGTDESAGTVVNDGLIESTNLVSPYAVAFGQGDERLVLDQHGSFAGAVLGGQAAGDTTTLELAAGTTGTLSGLGNGAGTVTDAAGTFTFSDFGTIVVDAGASWSISDPGSFPVVSDAGGLTVASGVTVGLAQIQASGTITLQGGASSSQTVAFVAPSGATLALDAPTATTPSAVQAAIDGFGLDGTIDLPNIANSLVTGFQYVGSTLAVLDNATTLAVLDMPGSFFSNSFAHAPDPGGGTFISTDVLPCFTTDTAIRTVGGDVSVQNLRIGDQVVCARGGVRPVIWIGHRRVDVRRHPAPHMVAPIRVRRDAFADGMPRRDLLLSPDHAVHVAEVLVPIRQLVNGTSIAQVMVEEIAYWHVELDRHDILFADGLAAESYLDTGNRTAFETGHLPIALHPDFSRRPQADRAADGCVPLAVGPDQLEPIWRRLAQRAVGPGAAVALPAATNDPDLRMLVSDREVIPVATIGDRFVFVLPRRADTVRIMSRAAAPSDLRPWLDDRRRLGVAVSLIVVRDGQGRTDIPVNHPDIVTGWYDTERDGTRLWRWTNGAAELPVPGGTTSVELHLAGRADYPVILGDDAAALMHERRQRSHE